jgi:small-conductance mechanosensitive channel
MSGLTSTDSSITFRVWMSNLESSTGTKILLLKIKRFAKKNKIEVSYTTVVDCHSVLQGLSIEISMGLRR